MDLITLANSIINAATLIDAGRKGFATKGKAEEGRVSYETGIVQAMSSFQEAQTTADPETILLAEYTFITQELEFCQKTDKESIDSLNMAIRFHLQTLVTVTGRAKETKHQFRNNRYLFSENQVSEKFVRDGACCERQAGSA